ncbi:MAG: DUF4251 domain-containing protein [Prevotella sp.]|nr:DUF4251 domain-containing protein [Prevotella sp.]
MKKILLLIMVVGLVACSTLTPAEKAERAAKQAAFVANALNDRHYKIDIQMMYPQRGPAKNVTGTYSLEVKGDSLISYLPYFGRAYQVPYGGGKGLNFIGIIERYSAVKDAEGRNQIAIELTNEEDTYLYMLDIFDNGSTTIDVRAKQREPISYSGEMVIDIKK